MKTVQQKNNNEFFFSANANYQQVGHRTVYYAYLLFVLIDPFGNKKKNTIPKNPFSNENASDFTRFECNHMFWFWYRTKSMVIACLAPVLCTDFALPIWAGLNLLRKISCIVFFFASSDFVSCWSFCPAATCC